MRRAKYLLTIPVLAAMAAVGAAQETPPVLKFGITGSDPTGEYSRVMSQVAVQRVLLDIAHQPRSRSFIDERLHESNVGIDQLLHLGLIRAEGDDYRIAFTLLTREDDQRVREVTAKYARFLSDGILKRRKELEQLLAAYDLPSVSKGDLAYVLIGCFALDWDGQDIAREEKYFTEAGQNQYAAWAQELGLSLKGMYWGSHNGYLKSVVFTSFGDHEALPRMALPDMVWRMSRATENAELAPELVKPSRTFADSAFSSFLEKTGAVMFSLRSGPKTTDDIAAGGRLSREELAPIIDLLLQMHYVRQDGNRYIAAVPVLGAVDRQMENAVRQVVWQVMHEWLGTYYEPLRAELQGITPLKYGVSYREHVFLQIWHYVFAMTNGQLVESGFFSSPYGSERRYKGFTPMVWDPSLEYLSR